MASQSKGRGLSEQDLTGRIIGAFYRVYDDLGTGFLESVYRNSMAYESRLRALDVRTEAPVEAWYWGARVGHFRADLLVATRIIGQARAR